MIKKSSIEDLKNKLDIVDVIGSYIELKKAGVNYKARCPFHEEKSASFVVSPSKQIYHCFGCGSGGDAISFVKEYEKLSYPEALEKLARENNVLLDYENSTQAKKEDKTLEQVNKFFLKNLQYQKEAMAYLQERGVFNSSIEKFEIGYSPSSGEQLSFLSSNHITSQDAVEAGVIAQDANKRFYARFIERITFPIYSANNHIVGFGGRTISNHPAKYINSPQTKLFNKSRLLYAYNIAKESIYRKKEIIVTEGYLDVIMLHQAGFDNTVATLGTALTSEHLPLLKKGEPRVILAYDGDNAGKNAALKAAKMLSMSSFDGGVVLFEESKDPADFVKEGKIDYLNALFKHPKKFIEFVIETIALEYDLNIPEQKQGAKNEINSFLKNLSPILQEEYISFASGVLKSKESFFKIKKTYPAKETAKSYDVAEMSMLKTLILNPYLVDYLLDVCDENIFEHHRDIFMDIIQNRAESKKLLELELNEKILPLSEDELKEKIKKLQILNLQKKLNLIKNDQAIDFKKKSFEIRKTQDMIKNLNQGMKP
ncbi:MAG: primase [Campylobacterota bacterium]|nr:primase [Campylobacterota bacterium]